MPPGPQFPHREGNGARITEPRMGVRHRRMAKMLRQG